MAQRFGSRVALVRLRRTGLRPRHSTVDADILHIGLDGDTAEHLLAHTKQAPTGKSLGHAVPNDQASRAAAAFQHLNATTTTLPAHSTVSRPATYSDVGRFS